jgi:solute carrier family 35 protein F1/2
LTLAASALYACSNVLQEKLVKFNDREEYMGVVGAFGMLIAALQGSIVDLPGMRSAKFTPQVVASLAGFVSCLFFMYTNTSSFLQEGDSILFNLSLLTSDVYAVLFSFLLKGYLVPWMYFLAFALVASGLGLYYSEKLPVPHQSHSQIAKLDANKRGAKRGGGRKGRGGATMAREEGEEEEEEEDEEEQSKNQKTSASTLISLVSGAGNEMAEEGTYSPLRSDDRSPPTSPSRR